LSVSPSVDLALADATTTGTQRIYRRLLTNPQLSDQSGNPISSPDYTWEPTYGGGLARKVGSPGNASALKALIKGQMRLESVVAATPEPSISVLQNGGLSSVTIQYTDANTATTQTVDFDVSNS